MSVGLKCGAPYLVTTAYHIDYLSHSQFRSAQNSIAELLHDQGKQEYNAKGCLEDSQHLDLQGALPPLLRLDVQSSQALNRLVWDMDAMPLDAMLHSFAADNSVCDCRNTEYCAGTLQLRVNSSSHSKMHNKQHT